MAILPTTDFKYPILPTVIPHIIYLQLLIYTDGNKRAGHSTSLIIINAEVTMNTLKLNDIIGITVSNL
jgi:hypothetical protein